MDCTFLGTASGTPTKQRNVSGLALRHDDGAVWIIDCGEGTQHQLLHTDIRPGRIERIFITHLHGDHCYGLPGLLACIAVHDRGDRPVSLYGPVGTRAWWELTARVSSLRLTFPVHIHEFEKDLTLEDEHSLGAWTCRICAIPHRVQSYAFVFQEPERRGRVDVAAAKTLGIQPGPQLGQLAQGRAVTSDAGREVRPEEVCGPARPGRKLVLCGDTNDAGAIIPFAQDADFVVHECTFSDELREKALQWGHSTAGQWLIW